MRNFEPVGKHKIVLDENVFESRFLRCSICKEKFNHDDRSPRLLPCHHCFCLACVLHFYWKEEEERQRLTPKEITDLIYIVTVTCPVCENSFVSTLEGLKELVADHRIIQLLDFVGSTDKQSIDYCPKHVSQPLNFFCEKCQCKICRDCIVVDHKQCSKDKMVLDLQSAFQKYDPALSTGVKEMEDEAKSLLDKKEQCKTAKDSFKRGDEGLVNAIKESFDRLRKALEEREEKLIDMARNSVEVKEYDFDVKMKAFIEKEEEVRELREVVKKSNNSSDIVEKYNAYILLKRYATEPAVNKEEYENKETENVTFNSKDESLITSRISNYGSIETKSESTSTGYGRSSSIEDNRNNTGSGSGSIGSSYVSSLGSYSSGSGRTSSYGSYIGSSSLYTGSSYTSRYTPRSYRY